MTWQIIPATWTQMLLPIALHPLIVALIVIAAQAGVLLLRYCLLSILN
jgi:hypothetical protein